MSKAVKKFNGLNGTVDIEVIKHLADLALQEGQTHLYERLTAGLEAAKKYNTVQFNPSTLAIEEVSEHDLPGLEQIPNYISYDEFHGLNKAVSPDDIYQYITDLILQRIEKADSLPWHKMWEDTPDAANLKTYINFESKKPYRGINFILLNLDEFGNLVYRENPYFLTFKQIEKNKGTLRKGSKATRVVYFTKLYKFTHLDLETSEKKLEYATYNHKKYIAWLEKNRAQIKSLTGKDIEHFKNKYLPILKYYNVFSGEDVDGIDFGDYPKSNTITRTDDEKIEAAEAIVSKYPNPPKIKFRGNQPAYYPLKDEILMTPAIQFKNPQFFYSVFFHELTHSTGHSKRLDRGNDTRRRDGSKEDKKAYNFEELVAEMGSVFLCAESGILFHTRDQSAKYLSHYMSKLKKAMKDDNRFFFRAASASQAAADYILDRDKDGIPAYVKSMGKKKTKNPEVVQGKLFGSWHAKGSKYRHSTDEKQQLKPGYKFKKGGEIEKVKVKKTKTTTKKTAKPVKKTKTQVKKVEAPKEKNLKKYINIIDQAIDRAYKQAEEAGLITSVREEFWYSFNVDEWKTNDGDKHRIYFKLTYGRDRKWKRGVSYYLDLNEGFKVVDASRMYNNASENKLVKNIAEEAAIFLEKNLAKKDQGIEILKTSPKGAMLITDGKKVAWIMPKQRRTDGTFTPGAFKALAESKVTKEENDKTGKSGTGTQYTLVKYESIIPVGRAYKITSFNGQSDFVPQSAVIQNYGGSAKSDSVWVASWALKGKDIQYGNKTKYFEKGLNAPDPGDMEECERLKQELIEPKPTPGGQSYSGESHRPRVSGKSTKVKSIRHTQERSPMFAIAGETSKFLQAVEKKPIDSVVVTLDGPQGAGKTTALYKFQNDFARAGNRCLFASLEEHPSSNLAMEKRDLYLSLEAQENIDTVAEFDNYKEFCEIVDHYDAIFIDSWQKLLRMIGNIKLDEDVRKKFNEKVFFIIFQQTTTGRTKGGAEIVFDGDIIIKLAKMPSFVDNYAYFDKNRYTTVPIETLKYMIADGICVLEGEENKFETKNEAQPEAAPQEFEFEVY